MDTPSLQSMEWHLQTSMEVWVDNNINNTFLDVDFTPMKQVLACLPFRYQESHGAVAGGS